MTSGQVALAMLMKSCLSILRISVISVAIALSSLFIPVKKPKVPKVSFF